MIDRTEAEDSYNVAPGTYRPVLHIEGDQFVVDNLHWGYRSAWAEASGKIPMAIDTRLKKSPTRTGAVYSKTGVQS